MVTLTIETDRETDGRWIAEALEIPGCLAYGDSEREAVAAVEALALRVVADRIEHGEESPPSISSTGSPTDQPV